MGCVALCRFTPGLNGRRRAHVHDAVVYDRVLHVASVDHRRAHMGCFLLRRYRSESTGENQSAETIANLVTTKWLPPLLAYRQEGAAPVRTGHNEGV